MMPPKRPPVGGAPLDVSGRNCLNSSRRSGAFLKRMVTWA
jgi:hypothetical protein